MRSQIRAIMASVLTIIFIAVAPYGLLLIGGDTAEHHWLRVVNPTEMVFALEFNGTTWLKQNLGFLVVSLVVFALLAIGCRLACLHRIDQRFGRVPVNFKPDQSFKPPIST